MTKLRYPKTMEECFPHPDRFGELLGYQLLSYDETETITELMIQEKHLSPSGKCHGGVLSAFVDYSMGACLFGAIPKGKFISTIEFKINYVTPLSFQERLLARSKIKYLGRSHAVLECHGYVEEGRDVIVALGTYNIY